MGKENFLKKAFLPPTPQLSKTLKKEIYFFLSLFCALIDKIIVNCQFSILNSQLFSVITFISFYCGGYSRRAKAFHFLFNIYGLEILQKTC